MRLLAEVKMRRERVLEQVHQKIPRQHPKHRVVARQMDRFRHHLDERGRQHEARAQRQKIRQETPRPPRGQRRKTPPKRPPPPPPPPARAPATSATSDPSSSV